MTYSGGSTRWTYDGYGRPDSQTQTYGNLTLKLQKTYDSTLTTRSAPERTSASTHRSPIGGRPIPAAAR